MGINNHLLNFLKYASKRNAIFGKTATIGRQKLMARNQHIQKTLNFEKKEDIPKKGDFCENLLLSHFGSEKVDSFDNSDYEGATITCDLNKPLPSHLSGPEYQYDTIIDAGTLEHIFNIPQAFKNISNMCKIGGTIIHGLPANNYCGHGFWQLSPELFFSLYSEDNGYAETEVFLAGLKDEKHWYKVKKPENGIRRVLVNCSPVLALVRTKKVKNFSHDNVQQSDYVHSWKGNESESNTGFLITKAKGFLKNYPEIRRQLRFRYQYLPFIKNQRNLSSRNIHLTKMTIKELIS